ncbi:MAG: hypothetical protein KDA93_27235 [Planctomycetaceae bacterium]|nr:hypothetical protein [Planctomycetaceae bacterium]
MAETPTAPPENLESGPNVPRRRRWLAVLVFLLPLAGLLWVSNWFYQRSRLFADSHVVLGEPTLPWGHLIGDENARELFGVPVEFNPSQKKLTSYQVGMIGGYTALKSLQLWGVTDADVHKLRGLTNLEDLSLYESPITDEACESLSELTGLQRLTLTGAKLTDAGCEFLGRMDHLQYLSLGDFYADSTTIEITDAGLSHLVGLTQLRGLDLVAPRVTDEGLKSLAKLQNLEALMLNGSSLSGDGLGGLSQLTYLRALGIKDWSLQEHALSELPKLGSLIQLSLWHCSLSDNCLNPVGDCNILSRLSLERSHFSDNLSLRPLEKCLMLESVFLEQTNATDAMLEDLMSVQSLCSLYLTQTNVSHDAALRFHQSHPTVFMTDATGHRLE